MIADRPTMHDIYDPPPAPDQDFDPPKAEPLIFTRGDLLCLVGLCASAVGGLADWPGAPSRRWRWRRRRPARS